MIIDNKTLTETRSNIKTVWEFLHKYTHSETLNIVTGYFTISALCLLKKFEHEPKMFRLILGEIADTPDLKERIIDVVSGDSSIANGFQLTEAAKKAIEFLEQDNVFVKLINSSFCHAKTYIYDHKSDGDACYYVTGSSNLTESGLGTRPSGNIELNIAERGSDRGNFPKLLEWFENTWAKEALEKVIVIENDKKVKKEVKQYFIDCIKNLFKEYQPKDIYYKILYELFNGDIEATIHDSTNKRIVRLEETVVFNTLFGYQKKGVKSLINMLNKYNGAILADAVGLGKTFSALAVIKYFQNEGYVTVVLCPKKLEENWQQYRYKRGSRFEQDQFDYEVRFHTDLQDNRLQDSYDTAKLDWLKRQARLLIVIDESHNLRNDKSGRYQYLLEHILSERSHADIKVLELSATPINTNINDVRNQFKLFVRGRDDGFDTPDFAIPSLQELFKSAQRILSEWSEKEDRKISDLVAALPDKFFNLTDKLVVARTRKMIEKSEGKSLGFPEKNKPDNIYLGIDKLGDLDSFDAIYKALLAPWLCAYLPNSYTEKREIKNATEDQRAREMFLVRMMLTLFLKRLESSWVACKSTVEKVLAHHENALDKVERFLKNRDDASVEEADLEDFDEDGDFALGKKNPVALSDMVDIEAFRRDLQRDIQLLKVFVDNMQIYHDQFYAGQVKDAKVERLKEIVTDKVNRSKKKVLIFTSYSDTAHYLFEQLNTIFPGRVACVDGGGATVGDTHEAKFQHALMRFAPLSKMYNEYDWSDVYHRYFDIDDPHFDRSKNKWKVSFAEWKKVIAESDDELSRLCRRLLEQPISILIATDCLSEGQNLQDAQTVINYDIHWNPVRLIQRVGRIDRIGSPNTAIDCINFWPTKSYEDYLSLANRINDRMATMALIGTETLNVSEELVRQLADNPIIDRNDSKLLDQLQNSIEDIEDGNRSFGLEDLSFENFRQDLVEYLTDKGDELRNMPNGVYSGFKTVDSLFDEVPESIVALVAAPHKPVGASNHKYEEYWLVLRPVNNERKEHVKVFNRQEILAILRANLLKKRNVPSAIDRGDSSALTRLKAIMQGWINEQLPQEQESQLADLFSGDFTALKKSKDSKLEEKFDPNNIDLITWEYISK